MALSQHEPFGRTTAAESNYLILENQQLKADRTALQGLNRDALAVDEDWYRPPLGDLANQLTGQVLVG